MMNSLEGQNADKMITKCKNMLMEIDILIILKKNKSIQHFLYLKK